MIGQEIGNYQIISRLGHGGMGEVFLGRHKYLPRQVAVKTIVTEGVDPHVLRTLRQRFGQEGYVQSQLRHEHIVQVEDFIVQEEAYYLVLEYMPGYVRPGNIVIRSVADELQIEARPMLYPRALGLFKQILQALDYAHNKEFEIRGKHRIGIIHRDIKPANFLFADQATVKLGDFGVVKVSGLGAGTRTGFNPGTYAYMSPEALQGEHELDARSDIYSLGVSLFEMLIGRTPLGLSGQKSRAALTSEARASQEAPWVRKLRAEAPEMVADFILRALQEHPDDRFPSVSQMLAELEHVEMFLAVEESEVYSETLSERVAGSEGLAVRRQRERPESQPAADADGRSASEIVPTRLEIPPSPAAAEPPPTRLEIQSPPAAAEPPPTRLEVPPPPAIGMRRGGTEERRSEEAREPSPLSPAFPLPRSPAFPLPGPPAPRVVARKFNLLWALAGIVVVVVALIVYFSIRPPSSPPPPTLSTKLAVWFEVGEGKAPYSDLRPFKSGQKFWLRFTSGREGYVYILWRSGDGKIEYLFPNPRTNQGLARVEKEQPIRIPDSDKPHIFHFGDNPQDEELLIVHAPDTNSAGVLESVYQELMAQRRVNPHFEINPARARSIQEFLDSIKIVGQRITSDLERAEFEINYGGAEVTPSLVKLTLRHTP